MPHIETGSASFNDIDILTGAVFSWCAERSIRLKSHEGIRAASIAIDLFMAGHQTQDELRVALCATEAQEFGFA